jgi:hypothetical protein
VDPVGGAGRGVSGDGGSARNLGVAGHVKAQRAQQRCGIEHDLELLSDVASHARIVLVAHGAHMRVPAPPPRTVSDTVVAVPATPVTLFANSSAIAPNPHCLFGLRRLGSAGTNGGYAAHRSAATRLLLGVGAERLQQSLFVAPGAVGRCNG